MATLGVTLARSGSKGLINKNLRDLCGRPMLAWTLDHALASGSIDRVVCSTDGSDLAQIASDLGVEVIQRPAELASDSASVADAARHALVEAEARGAEPFDAVVIHYGNVPIRPPDLTDRALAVLRETGCDSVQSVCRVGKTHPYWMKTVESAEEGGRLGAFIENTIDRRQDLPPVYLLDGGVIAVTRDSLMTEAEGNPHAFLGVDRRAVLTEPGEVIDVDTALDLALAEAMLRQGVEAGA